MARLSPDIKGIIPQSRSAKAKGRGGREKVRLSNHLMLNSFMLDLFGMKRFEDMQNMLGRLEEGFNEEGQSYVHNVLAGLKGLKVPLDKLEEYDSNIREYLGHINRRRKKPVQLLYFQYLAVLFTEIYLDRYFTDPVGLLNDLNRRPEVRENSKYAYGKGDLRKLAYWMATGSGKTLIMHINYLQFLRYNRGHKGIGFDSVLLITPGEMLSRQHLDEMHHSSIPCGEFSRNESGYFEVKEQKNNSIF